jgi:hypothetical protein
MYPERARLNAAGRSKDRCPSLCPSAAESTAEGREQHPLIENRPTVKHKFRSPHYPHRRAVTSIGHIIRGDILEIPSQCIESNRSVWPGVAQSDCSLFAEPSTIGGKGNKLVCRCQCVSNLRSRLPVPIVHNIDTDVQVDQTLVPRGTTISAKSPQSSLGR